MGARKSKVRTTAGLPTPPNAPIVKELRRLFNCQSNLQENYYGYISHAIISAREHGEARLSAKDILDGLSWKRR